MKSRSIIVHALILTVSLISSVFGCASNSMQSLQELVIPSQTALYTIYKQQQNLAKSKKLKRVREIAKAKLDGLEHSVYIDCVFQAEPGQKWVNRFIHNYCTHLQAMGITLVNFDFVKRRQTPKLKIVKKMVGEASAVILLCSQNYPEQHEKELNLINELCGDKKPVLPFVMCGEYKNAVPIYWRDHYLDGFILMVCGDQTVTMYSKQELSYIRNLFSTVCALTGATFDEAIKLAKKINQNKQTANPYIWNS